MNHNMDNTPQPTEQCLEKPTVNIGKLGFILSLISIPLCLIRRVVWNAWLFIICHFLFIDPVLLSVLLVCRVFKFLKFIKHSGFNMDIKK